MKLKKSLSYRIIPDIGNPDPQLSRIVINHIQLLKNEFTELSGIN